MNLLQRFVMPGFNGVLEIVILSIAFYYILLFIRGTRGVQVLFGLALIFIALILLTYFFQLDTLNWILQRSTFYIVFGLLVIFQPEIRQALAELGRRHFFGGPAFEQSTVDNLVSAADRLSEQKIGALIAVQRDIGMRTIRETGVQIDSELSPELLVNIFYPRTPLHDGGVIVQNNRVVAAACVFPLSQRDELSRTLGTRHRAAIGITEETDAIALVVSEETGSISVAYRGRLRRGLDEERLRRVLVSVLLADKPRPTRASKWPAWLRLKPMSPKPAVASPRGEEHVA
ncbi:MAG TPA: diadenylate cyclase CdaA [Kiritimatiellia bacterium]|nr:diadenylate cyclase CdaA [Kiritimatiellia bacterium]HMO98400.1 diadenylate cyclase CdaA [Kiritimatiellia bacterium]HMP96453.1 diadenylate cyclase CdaA [Kiritimatiellia bacterium]